MPAGDFPTEEAFDTFIASVCVSPFSEYVGLPYGESVLDISWIGPTREGWDAGDRSVACSIDDPVNRRLVGSARASKR